MSLKPGVNDPKQWTVQKRGEEESVCRVEIYSVDDSESCYGVCRGDGETNTKTGGKAGGGSFVVSDGQF